MRMTELRGPIDAALTQERWIYRLADVLRGAGMLLTRLALRIDRLRMQRQRRPELEFYAEAGAPEGALYVDGQLAGKLHGVTRL
jgi:hypothetical protein